MGFDVSQISSTLAKYSEFANDIRSDKVTVVRRYGGGLEGLARLRGVQPSTTSALDEFKNALSRTIGETLADQAWRAAGGGAGKGLTSGLIKKTLANANRICNSLGVEKNMVDLLSLSGPDELYQDVLDARGTNELVYELVCHKAAAIAKAVSLLGMTPATENEAEALKASIERVKKELESVQNQSQDEDAYIADKRGDAGSIPDLLHELELKKNEVSLCAKNLPGGDETLTKLAETWKQTLVKAVGTILNKAPQGYEKTMSDELNKFLAKYDDPKVLVNKLVSNKKSFLNGAVFKFLKMNKHLKLEHQLGKELEGICKSVCGTKKMPDGRSMKELLVDCNNDVLNRRAWKTISKSFIGSLDRKVVTLQSDITPGAYIGEAIAKGYDSGVNAYNCHTKNTVHAVNLATTEMKINDKTVFCGVRHAAHSAKGVAGKTSAEANTLRAEETAKAAFIEYFKMCPKWKRDAMENDRGKVVPIDFNLSSISLMTPSVINGEKSLFFDQKAAWQQINGQKLTVRIDGFDYVVRPNITLFSYGVNSAAIYWKGEPTTGWGNVSQMNRDSLWGENGLLTRANAFVSTDRKTAAAVHTLARQVEEIASKKSERTDGGEAYKMVSRLAVLTYLMGDVPVWNCKSGKDRTGMLDVEAKFLATLIAMGHEIPKPGAKLNKEEQALFNTIVRQSGNLEMQEYNTGAAGYKLGGAGLNSIKERVGTKGNEEAESTFKGGSGYVGS